MTTFTFIPVSNHRYNGLAALTNRKLSQDLIRKQT